MVHFYKFTQLCIIEKTSMLPCLWMQYVYRGLLKHVTSTVQNQIHEKITRHSTFKISYIKPNFQIYAHENLYSECIDCDDDLDIKTVFDARFLLHVPIILTSFQLFYSRHKTN